MYERLSVLGGGVRWLNLPSASKISGLDYETILQAMENDEFEYNRNVIYAGKIRHERSWQLIEPISFIRWLERRTRVDADEIRHMFARVIFQVGQLQHQINILSSVLRGQSQKRVVRKKGSF